jgi:Flp pilus assembly protein TadG
MGLRISRSLRGLSGRLKAMAASDAGTVTLEFVAWMPVFVFILALTADACKLYLTQADMWSVARDTARRMSTGQLATPADAQNYATGHLLYSTLGYTFTITQGGDDTVEIAVPVTNACVFGILPVVGNFSSAHIDAKVVMRAETEGAS